MSLSEFILIIHAVLILSAFGLVGWVMWLYHEAHGNEANAVLTGAEVVQDTLTRKGDIAPAQVDVNYPDKAINIEEAVDEDEDHALGLILARSNAHAEQLGQQELDQMMRDLDEKI